MRERATPRQLALQIGAADALVQLLDACRQGGGVVTFGDQESGHLLLLDGAREQPRAVHVYESPAGATGQHLDAHAVRRQLGAAGAQRDGQLIIAQGGRSRALREPVRRGGEGAAAGEQVRGLERSERGGAMVHQLALECLAGR